MPIGLTGGQRENSLPSRPWLYPSGPFENPLKSLFLANSYPWATHFKIKHRYHRLPLAPQAIVNSDRLRSKNSEYLEESSHLTFPRELWPVDAAW